MVDAKERTALRDLKDVCFPRAVIYPCVCNREFSGRRAEAILDWYRLFDVPACKI